MQRATREYARSLRQHRRWLERMRALGHVARASAATWLNAGTAPRT